MIREEENCIFVNFTNDYTSSRLRCLHDLVLSRLLSEPVSDCRKTTNGWSCVEKAAETRLNIQHIKNSLQQLNEIAMFII